MSLNHRVFCLWEFRALTVLDSGDERAGVGGYESKSWRIKKKERKPENERQAAAGRHVLNVSL